MRIIVTNNVFRYYYVQNKMESSMVRAFSETLCFF
jgi:hypothetical protein